MKTIITRLLREFADKIESNQCELSEENALELLSNIAHIGLDKSEAANRLEISERTFDRNVSNGTIPNGKKLYKNSKLVWYLDDILKLKNYDNNRRKWSDE